MFCTSAETNFYVRFLLSIVRQERECMSRRKSRKKRKRKATGVGAIVRPGVGAIYVRGAWMKKLDDLGKRKKKSKMKRK